MYAVLLYINRDSIAAEDQDNWDDISSEKASEEATVWYRDLRVIQFLYEEYRPSRWFWEVMSTLKRLLMTAVLSIVSDDSGIQVIYIVITHCCFLVKLL